MMKLFYITFTVLIFNQLGKSQVKGYELGPWIGGLTYFGDLNQEYDLTHPGPAIGFQGRYVMNSRLAISLRGGFGQLRGNDEWSENSMSKMRGLNFHSWLWDLTPQVEFNFLPYEHGSQVDNITPFVAVGASVFRFNPKGTYNIPQPNGTTEKMTFDLRSLGTEDQYSSNYYSKLGLALNTTLGLKWYIGNNWTFQVFATVRRTNTDYIDDVSTLYEFAAIQKYFDPKVSAFLPEAYAIDPYFLNSGQSITKYGTRDGKARGDDRTMDSYATFGIGATYFFEICKCPEVQR